MDHNQRKVCQLVHLFAFIHFLLDRCCFNIIAPVSEVWAFDMFQSLNASGTPLTALETFKPLVVNTVNVEGDGFKGSIPESDYSNIDQLMSRMTTAANKGRLTNEFLTNFALIYNGTKLSSQFSAQRKWLIDRYTELKIEGKALFIQKMSHQALYYENVVYYDPGVNTYIKKIGSATEEDKKIASLCVLYLKDAGHKMANTVLSRFYSNILKDYDNSVSEFIEATKALTAFFTIWRSSCGNSGLDEVYRKALRSDGDLGMQTFSWKGCEENFSSKNLKNYLRKILESKNLLNKEAWLPKAAAYLKFNNSKMVCRFALFMSAHDTKSDPLSPGLMVVGTKGSYPYLEPQKWISPDFKTIEHVAPRVKTIDSVWDKNLYNDEEFERIGNLTLLPVEINSSAGNKSWQQKLIYFLHLAETDADQISDLQRRAEKEGIELSEETIDLLKKSSHKHHIRPIVEFDATGKWDNELVDKRSTRICEILFDRVRSWLD